MRYCDFPRDHVSEEKGTGYCGRHTGTQAGSHALFRNTCCTWSFNAYWIWASVTNRRQRSEKQSTILLTLQKQYFLLFITLVCIFSFWHLHRKKNSCKKKAVVCVFFKNLFTAQTDFQRDSSLGNKVPHGLISSLTCSVLIPLIAGLHGGFAAGSLALRQERQRFKSCLELLVFHLEFPVCVRVFYSTAVSSRILYSQGRVGRIIPCNRD